MSCPNTTLQAILDMREQLRPFLIPFTYYNYGNMTANTLVELIEGLVVAQHGVQSPFTVVVPYDTNLEQQFIDGRDNLGTLRERIIRIRNVKGIRIGGGPGVSIEHYKGR